MKFLVLAAMLAAGSSILAGASAQAATLDYKATFVGQIWYCEDVVGICNNEEGDATIEPFLLEVSYLPYDVSESIVDGGAGPNGPVVDFHSTWKQLASLSMTIKGTTVAAVGVGDASWSYELCNCYYAGENQFRYSTNFSGVSGVTPVSFTLAMTGYRFLEEVPARGPLFHTFSSTPEDNEFAGSFTFGDMSFEVYNEGLTFDFESPAPVPLPASLPLFAGGLFGLLAVRRKQRRDR